MSCYHCYSIDNTASLLEEKPVERPDEEDDEGEDDGEGPETAKFPAPQTNNSQENLQQGNGIGVKNSPVKKVNRL